MVTILSAGTEVQVNTTTALNQQQPSITTLSNGDYVVAWASEGQDGSLNGVYTQIYSAAGLPIGGENRVNTTTFSQQLQPSVEALSNGGFAVVWAGIGADGFTYDVFLQRYDNSYHVEGIETLVNTVSLYSHQSEPAFAELTDGRFVVTWSAESSDGNGYGVFAQRYKADGTPEGGQTLVNTFTTGNQLYSDIASQDDGSYVIVWQSGPQDEPAIGGVGGSSGIYAQRFDIDGNPILGEFLVNTTVAGDQLDPKVVALTGGGYVVTWYRHGNNGGGIYSQILAGDGSPVGLETFVSNSPLGQYGDVVTALSGGGYVVVFASYDASGIGVFAQRYDGLGNAIGSLIQVNSTTTNSQYSPVVTATANDGFIVTWQSDVGDGSGSSIQSATFTVNSSNDLLPGMEIADGTSAGDVFTVGTSGLNAGDIVNGFGGHDVLNFTGGGVNTAVGATLDSIEEIQLTNATGTTLTVNDVAQALLVTTATGAADALIVNSGSLTVAERQTLYSAGVESLTDSQGTYTTSQILNAGVELSDGTNAADTFTVNAGGLNSGDKVYGADGHDILNFSGGGVNTAVGATLDSIEEIQLTNATGTTMTVNNVAQALLVTTATGASDALIVNSGSLTVAERQTLYERGIETLTDSQGTYSTSLELKPNIELSDGTTNSDVFSVNAGGLNAGDKVYGADGHDILDFTGGGVNTAVGATLDSIEEIQLTNATGTTLTVNNVAQAMLVTTATGAADALILNSGTFTVAQRRALFDLGVESLSDAQGTFLSTNAAPVTAADIGSSDENTNININVVQNDSDADGDTLTVVPGSVVITGFTPSAGLVLPALGGPVVDNAFFANLFTANGGNISFNSGNGLFNFLDAGQSITVTMTYDVTDGVSNTTQSTLTFTINGANEIQNLTDIANFGGGSNFGDNIFANGGDDVIYSLSGNDFISGGTGDDQLYGGDGNDTVNGDDEDDYVWGGSGDDVIEGGNGDDHLLGGSGIDRLTGGTGGDVLDGGGGLDVASYINSLMAVNIDLGLGTASGGEAEDDTLIRIENLAGSAFDDTLAGSSQANRIFGHGGNDVLTGLDGNDVLNGMGGDDSVEGGAGGDTLIGGTGTDLLSYASSNVGVTVDLGSGLATGGHATGDVILMFENLAGSNFDDTLNGTVGDNSISGASGDDDLSGYGGNDILSGGDGYDVLKGNSGDDDLSGGVDDDSLYGGDGDDRLEGGYENDQLYGGGGNDTFAFSTVLFGTDTVYGWVDGEDVIDLTGSGLTFASFTVTQVGSATHMTTGLDTIILTSTLASSIDVTDFVV